MGTLLGSRATSSSVDTGNRGIIGGGGGLERSTHFLFLSLFAAQAQHNPFYFSSGGTKPARQEAEFFSAPGYLVLLSSSSGGIAVIRPTFRFPFFCFLGYQRLCSFSVSLLPGFMGGSCELCLRGAAFVVFDLQLYLNYMSSNMEPCKLINSVIILALFL